MYFQSVLKQHRMEAGGHKLCTFALIIQKLFLIIANLLNYFNPSLSKYVDYSDIVHFRYISNENLGHVDSTDLLDYDTNSVCQ